MIIRTLGNKYKCLGQCPTYPKFSGTFGNFMCQMAQKHCLSRAMRVKKDKKCYAVKAQFCCVNVFCFALFAGIC